MGPAVDPHAPAAALSRREGDDAARVLGDEHVSVREPVQTEPEVAVAGQEQREHDEPGRRHRERRAGAGPRDADAGENEAGQDQEPQHARRSHPGEADQPRPEAPGHASGDVGRLQHAHAAPGARGVVVHRALQHRERDAHEHGGQAVESERQHQVETPHRRPAPGAPQVVGAMAAPQLEEPGEERGPRGQAREREHRQGGAGQQRALAGEERHQRPAQAADEGDADEGAHREAEQVHGQHRAEGERGRLDRHVDEAEPHDLERQRAEPAQGEKRAPGLERKRSSSRLQRGSGGRGRRRTGGRARGPRRGEPGEGREQVPGRRHQQRLADPVEPHQEPRGHERTGARAEDVEAVEQADRACRVRRVTDRRAHEQRQRHPHQDGGQREREEVEDRRPPRTGVQPARPQVEPIVVETAARETEEADGQLEAREGEQRGAGREPGARDAAEVAAEPEADHERGHDHRDGVDPHAAVQGQEPLPRYLVDESGRAAEEKRDANERDPRVHAGGSYASQGEKQRAADSFRRERRGGHEQTRRSTRTPPRSR